MAKSPNKDSFSGIYKAITIFSFILVLCVAANQINTMRKTTNMVNTENTITSSTYTCDGGATIQAQFFDDKAEVTLPDNSTLLLMQGLSASGVRYTNSDESVTFWTKGNTSFLEEGNTTTYDNCVTTSN